MHLSTEALYSHFLNATGVSIDTRSLNPGEMFFALPGEKVDGHRFVAMALEKGASYAVVSQESDYSDERVLVVENVLVALQALATHHRKQWQVPVIGLTGSNGKTTTKELLREVLATRYTVHATAGNLNNHIGVPLTLLRKPEAANLVIVEMGANKVGDIAELCGYAAPTHGFITNIGHAHLEGFGGFEGVLRGKTELFDFLRNTSGTVFINSQDPVLGHMIKRFAADKVVAFGSHEDFSFATLAEASPYLKVKNEAGQEAVTHLVGSYNLNNIMVALCVGKFMGVGAAEALKAIAQYVPANHRSQVIERGTNVVIADCYNANPDSMKAALQNLSQMAQGQKVAILGDMFELGQEGPAAHEAILLEAQKLGITTLAVAGHAMAMAAANINGVQAFETTAQLKEWVVATSFAEAAILVKASRGMAFEQLLDLVS